jgi:hypothetical protein
MARKISGISRSRCLAGVWMLAALCVGCGNTHSSVSGSSGSSSSAGFTQSASTEQWSVSFDTGSVNLAGAVAADPSGNVIIAGTTYGSIPLSTAPVNAQDLVAKFDTTGKQLWLKQFGAGGGNNDTLSAVGTDTQGNIYVGGSTAGAFPGFANPGNSPEAVVLKLDASGNVIWVRQFPGGNGEGISALTVTIDGSGDLAVTGAQTLQYQQENLVSGGSGLQITAETGLLALLDGQSGSILWQHAISLSPITRLAAIATDSLGTLYVAGNTQSSYSAPPAPVLLQYSSAGSAGWKQQLQGTMYASDSMLSGVAVGPSGSPIVVGCPMPNSQSSVPGCLLAEFNNADGSQAWLSPFGLPPAEAMSSGGIGIDPSGNILFTGYTTEPLLASFSASDQLYLAKFNSNGGSVWVQQFNDNDTDHLSSVGDLYAGAPSLAVDSTGNAYVGDNTLTTGTTPAGGSYGEPLLIKFGP